MSTISSDSSAWLRRFQFAVMRDWRVVLLAVLGVVLSLASGYTTWKGMTNFTGESILSLMVTVGIQGIMLVTAWMIGQTFANNPARSDNPLAGYGKGLVTIFRHLPLWAMFLSTMLTSAFFSFDALFSSNLYGKAQRVETGRVYTRSEIEGMMTRIDGRLVERRKEAHIAFLGHEGWEEFRSRLGEVGEAARAASDTIEQHLKRVMARRALELKDAERALAGAKADLLKVVGAANALEAEVTRDEPLLESERKKVDSLGREFAELVGKAEAEESAGNHEDDGTRGTGKQGKGPEWRKHMEAAARFRKEAANVKKDLDKAQTALKVLDDRLTTSRASLKRMEGERRTLDASIRRFESEVQAAKAAQGVVETDFSLTLNVAERIERLSNGISNIRRNPESLGRNDRGRTGLDEVSGVCDQLIQALAGTEDEGLKQRAQTLSCALSGPAVGLAAVVTRYDDRLREFRKSCGSLSSKLAGSDVETLVNEGRTCVEVSGLASGDTQDLMLELTRLKLEHGGDAHPFVVAKNALFLYREPLAYLAAAIALIIDLLVFFSGVIGAHLVGGAMKVLGDPAAAAGATITARLNTTIGMNDPDEVRNAKSFLEWVQSDPKEISGQSYMGYVEPEAIADTGERAEVLRIVNAGSTKVGGKHVIRPHKEGERMRFYVMREFYEELAANVVAWNEVSPPPTGGGVRSKTNRSGGRPGIVGGSARTLADWVGAQSGAKS